MSGNTIGNALGALRVRLDVSALDAELDRWADEAEAAARPAAQAGAQVLYDEVQRNMARIKRHTGNLHRAIYQAYSADNSRDGKATYHISWNARRAPHGHLVEFGHLQRYEITYDKTTQRFVTHKDRPLPQPKQVAARPFVRPAAAKLPQATQAMLDRFWAEMDKRKVTKA